jgi:hypothetical protein
MQSDVLAVDQVVLAADADAAASRAGALSLVFANAAARAAANQVAGSPGADPKSWADSFAGTCLQQLGGLGWRITDAGHSRVQRETSSFGSATTTLAAVLGGGGANGSAQQAVDVIRDLSGSADPSSAPGRLLSFWWSNAADVSFWLFCGLGAIGGSGDSPTLAFDLVQLDLTALHLPSGLLHEGKPFQPTSVTDLFVDVAADSLKVVIRRSISADLDNAVFGAKRGSVEARLGDKFGDHYLLASGAHLDP